MKIILLIPGSLRKGSLNKLLIKNINSLEIADLETKIFELNEIPLFNEDLEQDLPASVNLLFENLKWADAVLISTPEYNNTIPSIVTNLMHWLSRSYSSSLVKDKPLAITGVSTGGFGTVRAQHELLLLATIIKFNVNADFRFPVSNGGDVFDEVGQIKDEEMSLKLTQFLVNFTNSIN